MLDLIAYITVRFFNLICHIMPTALILFIGRRFGRLVYWINSERRRIGYANMRAAYCKSKSPTQIKKMLKSMYRRMTETFAEVLCLTKVNNRYIDHYIKIENAKNFWLASKEGKGVIFLTAHFGNWELSGMVISLKGLALCALAREQKMKRTYELMNRLRESKGLKVVRKGITTRYIIKALHEQKTIGMVSDQDAGKGGVMANFFGRPASTADGPFRFAARTGAAILPAFMARIGGPYHLAVLEKPIKIGRHEDIKPYIQGYNDLLQRYVSKYYDQWLWLHRRWKSGTLKNIVILSDGKPGHLNQSLSLAALFKRYREENGFEENDTRVDIVEIRFKNKVFKALLNLSSIFSSKWCQGCLRCLKFTLTKSSYEKLEKTYADVVISTGFSLAGVNAIFKHENNAKNAVCMKPGFLCFKKFDMIALPQHDVRKSIRSTNVIITATAPNVISGKYLEEMKDTFSDMIKLERPKALGVLMGGDNKDFEYSESDVREAVSQILDASKSLDLDILFTTSRRTGGRIENVFKEKLEKDRRCKFLIIANERNIPNAVGGILAHSDLVLVSGESTSMVSEAVSSGRKVIVFKGKKISKHPTKHEAFLNRLLDAGFVKIAEVRNLSEAINKVYRGEKDFKKCEDDDWIYRNMWRLGA